MLPGNPKIYAAVVPLLAVGLGAWLAQHLVPQTVVASLPAAAGAVKELGENAASQPPAPVADKTDPSVRTLLATTDAAAGKLLIESLSCSQLVELCCTAWPDAFPRELTGVIRETLRRFPLDQRLKAFMAHVPKEMQLAEAVLDLAEDMLPAKPVETIALLKHFSLDNDRCQTALKVWAETDFAGALNFGNQLNMYPKSLAKLIIPFARRDLDAAKALALGTSDSKLRWSLMTEVASMMAEKDLMAGITWAHENGNVHWDNKLSNSGPAGALFERIASADPLRAAECLAQNAAFFSMDTGPCENLFEVWADKDLPAASAWLAKHPLPDNLQERALRSLFRGGAEKMPIADVVTAWQALPPSSKSSGISVLSNALLKEEPEVALSTLKSVLTSPALLHDGLSKMLASDKIKPAFILSHLAEFKSTIEKNPSILDNKAKFSDDERSQLLAALSPEAQAAVAKMELRLVTKAQNYEAALALVQASGLENQNGGDVANLVANAAEILPQRVADFVTKLPENESRVYAVQNLMMTWAKTDEAGATKWANSLVSGASQDQAFRNLVELQASRGDSGLALATATRIADPTNQVLAYRQALQRLWNQDPSTAKAMLTNLNLPEEQRLKVESNLAR